MILTKTFPNGLRLVVNQMKGFSSVSSGIIVKTGSVNETESENGISHFIEHMLFKGTNNRSSFEISDYIDRIGAQINAFTSKEITCYYTKSTAEHLEHSLEVLSDLFFNSVFDEKELERERGVVIEEINMCEDTPEDICLDLLAESYFGKNGLGKTILGPAENIRRFGKAEILDYMKKYYTADNVVISLAGDVDLNVAEELVNKYFAESFKHFNSASQYVNAPNGSKNLFRTKKIEQSHIALSLPTFSISDERNDLLTFANIVFGGGMSSRLFQKIREELGLAYSVYSYASAYKDLGVCEIYAGVNTNERDNALSAIVDEIKSFKNNGITEKEFERSKEQVKSSFIYAKESTASQMLLYGKHLLFKNEKFDADAKIKFIESAKLNDVNNLITHVFDIDKCAVATVGPKDTPLKI
ncbi:MAG: insulinase family protein [Clostridia bacterium]|nr:insulinase family protein [Clostridia bacterium]